MIRNDVCAHAQVLINAHACKDTAAFRYMRDTELNDLMRLELRQLLSLKDSLDRTVGNVQILYLKH